LPVKLKEKILIEKKYLSVILKKANAKLSRNYSMLKKFENVLKQELAEGK
jgi:tRNA(Phe) wybutosine-synthesizing methylase Tyw3